ncbi:putative integral membrane protein [Neofusicoccum parvum UCRNP2]|uniref:Putative integral membrane protein n=1 Tax=Botryosphaeria parva (strain UCR-NP2) TaxID=1287680 RepID=R1EGD3_BOTPV|nr:putative integral membrane protein [Neofusicoccum parvum UCRNP2]
MALLRRLAIGLAVLANAALVPRTTASLLAPRQPSEPTQNQTAPASATFIYSNPRAAGNLTFSLAAVEDGGLTDLYFHLSAPAANSWVAVGIGAQMKGALMFLVYHDSRGENVTLSPRVASGENEPSYRSSIDCSVYESDGIPRVGVFRDNSTDGDVYSVNAQCKDVKSAVPDLSLDLESTSQPFIFAVGPWDHDLYSNEKDAGIRRHEYYGAFSMNMTQATEHNATAAGTAFGTQMEGAEQKGSLRRDDGNRGAATHAVFMCGTFLFIFPVGVVLLRSFERVMWHAGAQAGGLLVICAGVGLGIWISKYYNKSSRSDIALGDMGYHGQNSRDMYYGGTQPVQPRTMV